MLRVLPLLLVLTACSTAPAHRELRQSALPQAPAFEPAWEAPHTTGQPGYVGRPEDVPRSPSTRVLPQTPDSRMQAGVWASDAPPPTTVELLGFQWPLPPEADGDADALAVMRECANGLGKAVWASKEAAKVRQLGQPTLDCIAASALSVCVHDNLNHPNRWEALRAKKRGAMAKALSRQAQLLRDMKCAPPSREDAAREHFNWITAHWQEVRQWE